MIAADLARVTKRFGETHALDDVSFAVGGGEVVALLGPNGAGKTTALAVLLGLRRADAGRATIFGRDPVLPATRARLGVTPQATAFPESLRVGEIVDFVRAHYPGPTPTAELLERFLLSDLAHRQTGGLSGGERRRLAVALAFAGDPRLLVLDEPTTGLDAAARAAVWDAVRSHGRAGRAALLTTHHLDEAEALATRIVLIDRGRIVADGDLAGIKAAAGLTRITFRAPWSGLVLDGARIVDGRVSIFAARAGATVAQLVSDGVPLDELEVRPVTLEEALARIGETE